MPVSQQVLSKPLILVSRAYASEPLQFMYMSSVFYFLSQYSKARLCNGVQHVTDELEVAGQQNMSGLEFKMASGVSNSATQDVRPQQTLRELASLQHEMQQHLVSSAYKIVTIV